MNSNCSIYTRKIVKLIAIVSLLFLIVIPLLLICTYNLYNNGSLDLKSLMSGEIGLVFFNTLKLGFWVVIISSLVAIPLAFLTAKTNIGFKKVIDIAILIPFMTPPYIEAMGWTLFMQKKGYLESLLPALSFIRPCFFTFSGLVIIMSLHVFPFMYLSIRNCLLKINSNLEDAAFVHGGNFFYTTRRITLPLLLSSYAVGALLVFLRTTAEFGVPATFGRKIGYYVLTTEIFKYVSNWPIDFGKASSLSLLLVLSCLILWYFQNSISSKHAYSLLGSKGAKVNLYKLSITKKIIAWIYLIAVFIFSTVIPFFSVILTSIIKVKGLGISSNNFTLSFYKDLISPGSDAFSALITTFSISILASILTVILGTFYGLLIGRKKKGIIYKLIDIFSLLPNTVPGIVIIIGLILFFNSPYMPIPIYNTYGMVILTYVILFLPYTVQYISNSYGQINHNLEEAAEISGSKFSYLLFKIILPLNSKAIIAGFIMTFIVSIRELVASLMILPPSVQNSASYIYSEFEQGSESSGMAMAVVTIFLTVVLLIALQFITSLKKEKP